jgi:hypothetical protein
MVFVGSGAFAVAFVLLGYIDSRVIKANPNTRIPWSPRSATTMPRWTRGLRALSLGSGMFGLFQYAEATMSFWVPIGLWVSYIAAP